MLRITILVDRPSDLHRQFLDIDGFALIDLEHGLILDKLVFPSIVLLLILAPFWSDFGFSRTFFGDETLIASLVNSFLSGLGAFLVWSALESGRIPSALVALGLIAGALGGCRLLGVVLDGGLGPTLLIGPVHVSALIFELGTSVLAFVALSRVRNLGLSAA